MLVQPLPDLPGTVGRLAPLFQEICNVRQFEIIDEHVKYCRSKSRMVQLHAWCNSVRSATPAKDQGSLNIPFPTNAGGLNGREGEMFRRYAFWDKTQE